MSHALAGGPEAIVPNENVGKAPTPSPQLLRPTPTRPAGAAAGATEAVVAEATERDAVEATAPSSSPSPSLLPLTCPALAAAAAAAAVAAEVAVAVEAAVAAVPSLFPAGSSDDDGANIFGLTPTGTGVGAPNAPAVVGEVVVAVPELLILPEPHTLDGGLDGGLPAVSNENDGTTPAPTPSPPLLPLLTYPAVAIAAAPAPPAAAEEGAAADEAVARSPIPAGSSTDVGVNIFGPAAATAGAPKRPLVAGEALAATAKLLKLPEPHALAPLLGEARSAGPAPSTVELGASATRRLARRPGYCHSNIRPGNSFINFFFKWARELRTVKRRHG
ncbi:unnamed protein product [Ectocarpus sp. CCAP 1310/34]|nr:unnamed protein product [Ectocarpus sp. CCAP 1310/34]